ncbi:MAG: hypothetical protein AAB875_01425, partial [Patescibacteria group bacterium]
MELIGVLHGGQAIIQDIPVRGNAANIVRGAAVMKGTTDGTNVGFAIVATGAGVDVLGVLIELTHVNTVAGDDSNATGTNYTLRRICIDPFALYRAEYDTADTMTVASVSAGDVTVTSAEATLQGGWLYATG